MKIYLTSSNQNATAVEALAAELLALGHEVFLLTKAPNGKASWFDAFSTIAICDLLIFALTPQSLSCSPCELEYQYAHSLRKRILPVMLDPVTLSLLPLPLTAVSAVDCSRLIGDRFRPLTAAIHNLPPPIPPLKTLPILPNLIAAMVDLRQTAENMPLNIRAQERLFTSLEDFLERRETFDDALDILKIMQQHHNLAPELARQIIQLLDSVERSRDDRFHFAQFRSFFVGIGLIVVVVMLIGIVLANVFPGAASATIPLGEPTATYTPATPTLTPTLDETGTMAALIIQNTAAAQVRGTLTASVPSATFTETRQPTRTPTATITNTPTATATATATLTATFTPTVTFTPTIASPTPTSTASYTPTLTPTFTPSPNPTRTPMASSPTPTPG